MKIVHELGKVRRPTKDRFAGVNCTCGHGFYAPTIKRCMAMLREHIEEDKWMDGNKRISVLTTFK
jgi:hypothetical protein